MSQTPSIVQAAFVPDHEHELSLEAVLVLESLGCRYLTGGTPGLRDALLVWLAITDLPALKTARAKGSVEAHIEAWSAARRPAELLALQPVITRAVEAAFAPAAPAAGEDPADPAEPLAHLEKKGPPDAAGG